MDQQLNLACRVYIANGIALVPIRPGTKAPLLKDWTNVPPPALSQCEQWIRQGVTAFGMRCGEASGGAEILDFDTCKAAGITGMNVYDEWLSACRDIVDRYDLPVQQTGSGSGVQVAWRCAAVEPNQKLAWCPDETQTHGKSCIIETRGAGGQTLLPPSLHPSGGRYTLLRGKFSNIPVIRRDEREYMVEVARLLTRIDEPEPTPTPEQKQRPAAPIPNGMLTNAQVIELYNDRNDIATSLLRYRYTDAGRGRYSRPGKAESAGVSINAAENKAYAFSSNDAMAADRNGGNQPFSPFDLFCENDHGGDIKQAIRAAAVELGVEYRLHTLLLVDGYEQANTAREIMFPQGWVVRTMNGKADISGQFDQVIVWGYDQQRAAAVASAVDGIPIAMRRGYDPISMARDGILMDYLNAVKASQR